MSSRRCRTIVVVAEDALIRRGSNRTYGNWVHYFIRNDFEDSFDG